MAPSTVKVTFLGDATSLARAAQAARGSLDSVAGSVGKASKMGTFLGSAAGNLAVVGLAKVKQFATGSVDAFAAVEDATGAAGVEFGSQLPSVVDFATRAAGSFGLSKRAALEAQNTFGTLGKVAGLTGAPLVDFSQKLTGLAGDLASFKGTSTEQAVTAVGAALRGEAEPIRAYGVLLDEASLKAQAMSTGLVTASKNADGIKAAHQRAQVALTSYNTAVKEHGKDSAEAQKAQAGLTTATGELNQITASSIGPLTQQQKVLAAQSLILKQTGDAQGDYTRTASSTANVQKTLTAESENAQAVLGQRLAPALTALRQLSITAMGAISGLAAGIAAGTGFITGHADAFKVLAAVVGAIMLPAMVKLGIQWVVTGATATLGAARQVAAWAVTQLWAYKSMLTSAGAFAAQIAGWIRSGAVAMAQGARVAAGWLLAIGPIAIVIAAVAGVVYLIVKHWAAIRAATVAAWHAVTHAVSTAVSAVIGFVRSHWPLLLAIITGPIGLAVLAIVKNWDRIKAITSAAWNAVRGAVSRAWSAIVGAVRAGVSNAVNVVKGLPGQALSALGNLGSLLLHAGEDLIMGLVHGITNKIGAVKDTLGGLTSKLTSWKGPPGRDKTLLTGNGRLIIQGLIDGIENKYPDLKASLAYLTSDGIPTWLKTPVTKLAAAKAGGDIATKLAEGIKAKADTVKQAVDDLVQKFTDRLTAVKDFSKAIRDAFSSSGSVTGIDTKVAGVGGAPDTEGGFDALLKGLQAKARAARAFTADMAKLRKQGLNATTLAQLRDAGPDGGLKAAQQLLSGGAGGIAQVNALTYSIASSGGLLADREARANYGITDRAKLDALSNKQLHVIFDVRGDDADQIKRIRKQIRLAGGNVQAVLGS